jgi:L-seryl-tRNA(Ser) seleniumtransferase
MDPAKESMVHGSEALKTLPSVDRLLKVEQVAALVNAHGARLVTDEARALLQSLRERLAGTGVPASELTMPGLADALIMRCDARLSPRMRPVFNLTGTVIHTNLGRALLADEALGQVLRLMTSPNNLEFDLQTGRRGDRDTLVESLLCELTGAQAATVVNNNAAAVLLTIAALARDREVIVSRGELVEIGGAFRLPEVMQAAGARLIEVGTTNRTHPQDYERAIGAHTGLLMKVHTSNYAIQGFTCEVGEAELARIAHARGLPLATDLGSGSLVDLTTWGLPAEPLPQRSLADGCDVVTFSGDKLLGGPQAGLIVGSREAIERIRRCPLKRALRVSKLPLAALEATLRLYLSPELLPQRLPTLRLLTRPAEQIRALAHRLQPLVQSSLGAHWAVQVVDLSSQIGSGSLPVERLPSAGLALVPQPAAGKRVEATQQARVTKAGKGAGRALDRLAAALRALKRPVIGRIAEDQLLLDLRCLEEGASVQAFIDQLPQLALSMQ